MVCSFNSIANATLCFRSLGEKIWPSSGEGGAILLMVIIIASLILIFQNIKIIEDTRKTLRWLALIAIVILLFLVFIVLTQGCHIDSFKDIPPCTKGFGEALLMEDQPLLGLTVFVILVIFGIYSYGRYTRNKNKKSVSGMRYFRQK